MSKSNPLERAFKLMDIVASSERPMSLNEIVQISELPQSSAFRLLSNLVESGMLNFENNTKTYSKANRLRRLSLFVSGQKSLKEILKPTLNSLAQLSQETSFFVAPKKQGNTLLDFAVPKSGANTFIHPGNEFPAHATAAGKVIRAFGSEEISEYSADEELIAYQAETVTDPTALKTLFEQVRNQGYAINDSELDKDVFSVCVPVAMAGEFVGAIGIVGPKERLFNKREMTVEYIVDILAQAAADISTLLR